MSTLVAFVVLSTLAEAGTRVIIGGPRATVRVGIGPWSPRYHPGPRPGYVWVAGRHLRGGWVPGYWRPVGPAPGPGWVFVAGHWEGAVHVDGFWRPPANERVWVEGRYRADGSWEDGHWEGPAANAVHEAPAAPVESRAAPVAERPLAIPAMGGEVVADEPDIIYFEEPDSVSPGGVTEDPIEVHAPPPR